MTIGWIALTMWLFILNEERSAVRRWYISNPSNDGDLPFSSMLILVLILGGSAVLLTYTFSHTDLSETEGATQEHKLLGNKKTIKSTKSESDHIQSHPLDYRDELL